MTVLTTPNTASQSTTQWDRIDSDDEMTSNPTHISPQSASSKPISSTSYFLGTEPDETQDGEDTMTHVIDGIRADEQRKFRFNINNDAELQTIVNNDVNMIEHDAHAYIPPSVRSDKALTSEYVLSKLYNYMKISEMSKYGIEVFDMTFSSYLPYLTEGDIIKLSTSYWCNGQHFNCMVAHRGYDIKCNVPLMLLINDNLLDAAMQSGASVDKIEAMLVQKRIDDNVHNKRRKSKENKMLYYHTKDERNFYLRNLHHRFWNHEVLVRVFIQNGWMTAQLANNAMNVFVKNVYYRVIQSQFSYVHKQKRKTNVGFSENFLHSFFVSYFCLDDLPKMYKDEIDRKKNTGEECCSHMISAATLRRWCELIELLASRGANVNPYEFRKVIPLQYALRLGQRTFKIISWSHAKKNKELIPESYNQHNIVIPNDIWDITVSYL